MMAMSDGGQVEDRPVTVKTVALTALLGLVLLFALGAVAGALMALAENPSNWGRATLTIAGALVVASAATLGIVRLRPWARTDEPISPKTRKARNMLFLSGALGGVIGAVLAITTISADNPFALYSNSPLAPAVVIPVLAVWFLVVPVISWLWHRNVDEHERESYQIGGLAALYLYAFIAPAWWLAWRGGLTSEPETMVIYLIVLGVWLVGWFWRRYR